MKFLEVELECNHEVVSAVIAINNIICVTPVFDSNKCLIVTVDGTERIVSHSYDSVIAAMQLALQRTPIITKVRANG
jgi:hypothetical protein